MHVQYDRRQARPGFSLLEVILFIGILSIIIGTVLSVSISTEEARIRQKAISEVEQRGAQIMETITKNIRRAEGILIPAINQTGSVLGLQMSVNGEFPTLFAGTATGNLLLIQKTSVSPLLSTRLIVDNIQFRNVNGRSIVFSFNLSTVIPLLQKTAFSRHLEATATLFPSDQKSAGGCGSCPIPSCENHTGKWYHCNADSCMLSEAAYPC